MEGRRKRRREGGREGGRERGKMEGRRRVMGGGIERVREYSFEFTVLTISCPVILRKII